MAIGYGEPVPKSTTAKDKRESKRAKARNWERVRQACLVRDDRRCRVCHVKDGTDVHHIKLRSAGGADDTSNCCCLCRVCHAAIHSYRLSLTGNANAKLRAAWL